jgi:sulfur-oxidizing protein SoxX
MSMRITAIALLGAALATAAAAQTLDTKADAAIKSAFPTAPADWASRFEGDKTMQQCSASRNNPSLSVRSQIEAREKASIVYPPDNNFMGDWKKGEAIAQSGYGLRFTDYPPRQANGGNCYACHQLSKAEVSYGTLGPSLSEYGKLRAFNPDAMKAVYEKIYNSHVAYACSTMPRFGANKILTIEQIKDAVALLMSPDSPVNK